MGGDVSEGRKACAASDLRTWMTLPEVVFSARAGRSLPLQLMKTHRRAAQELTVSVFFLHAGTVTEGYSVRTLSQRR